jgi:predicted DNA-binding antitoxin AbrB/MazE fold protein
VLLEVPEKEEMKMAETVTVAAVYENGILRPTRPLNLREQQTVYIQIISQESEETPNVEAEQEMKSIVHGLIQAGLLTPPPGRSDVEPMSDQERRELAEELGRAPGKPLSEIIIEDRGEW